MVGPVDFELETTIVDGKPQVDRKITAGEYTLVNGAERVAQSVEIRLRALRGEWFLDRTFGVPWFQSVLGQPMISEAEYDAVVKAAILEVDGVNRIVSFESSFTRSTRVYNVEFVADTIYGPIDYKGVLP